VSSGRSDSAKMVRSSARYVKSSIDNRKSNDKNSTEIVKSRAKLEAVLQTLAVIGIRAVQGR
jgi:hypothetical protein